jgi:hypothetical protein
MSQNARSKTSDTFSNRILQFLGLVKPSKYKSSSTDFAIDQASRKAMLENYESYLKLRNSLMESSNDKYVLFESKKCLGVFDNYSQAIRAGYKFFGVSKPFLVQRVGRDLHAETYL